MPPTVARLLHSESGMYDLATLTDTHANIFIDTRDLDSGGGCDSGDGGVLPRPLTSASRDGKKSKQATCT